jgi:hypothetical protein
MIPLSYDLKTKRGFVVCFSEVKEQVKVITPYPSDKLEITQPKDPIKVNHIGGDQ